MDEVELSKKLKLIQKLTKECLGMLSADQKPTEGKRLQNIQVNETSDVDKSKIDFSIPIRPFVKRYAKDMSGPKKFTLILAYLSRGSLERKTGLAEVERVWNKMNTILGIKFNRFYPQAAKDNDWVISEKIGVYSLRPSWLEIFN